MNSKKTINIKAYRPRDYQLAAHNFLSKNKKGKILVVNSPRQCGKSLLLINCLLLQSVNYPSKNSIAVSPVLSQSRKLFKELKKSVEDLPIIKSINETRLEIDFLNGSSISFKSAEQRDSLRGFTVSGLLVIDEGAFIPDDIFYLLLPTTDAYNANIIIASTPMFKIGFFYEYYLKGATKTDDNVFTIDLVLDGYSLILDECKLDYYRQSLPKNKFKSEYLGQFLDNDSALFGDITNLLENRKSQSIKYSIGIDWGTGVGKDSTSISIMDDNFIQIATFSFNDIEASKQVSHILKLINRYVPYTTKIIVENNSIGSVYASILREELQKINYKGEFERFNMTNASKSELIEKLQLLVESKTITLVNDKKQLLELSMYEAKVNPKTNSVSYNAPSGYHDDTVISLLLSIRAATRKGNYNNVSIL